MCPGVQCSILDVVTIFDYISDGDSHGILAEFQQNSNGIPRIPMGIILGGSGIPTISVGIPRKKVGISMELETKMAEAPANCFPLKFHGIPRNSDFLLGIQQNPQELMEEGKDLNCTRTRTALVSADTRLRAAAPTSRMSLMISMLGYGYNLTDLYLGSSPLVED